ncbi:MAG: hypothetical protein GY926_21330 [bacterium]|nr:hypothetical protein [bacterium]
MYTRLTVVATALLLVLGACGGDTADTTTPTLPTLSEDTAAADTMTATEVDPEEAFQEYSACMREQGIEMPDPESGGDTGTISIEGGPGDFDFTAFKEAAAECGRSLDAVFGEFEMSPEQEAERMDQELAFAQCMRDEGVDWPDPDTSDGGMMVEIPSDIDPEQMNEAMQTCSESVYGTEGGSTMSNSVSSPTP